MWQIIKQLEETSSTNDKKAIIENVFNSSRGLERSRNFYFTLLFALNPYITFGVSTKSVPESKKDGSNIILPYDENQSKYEFLLFLQFLSELSSRKITGNDARKSILEIMDKVPMDEWNYLYRRILLKDLKCGVSIKNANAVLSKQATQLIPEFTCQLAKDSDNEKNGLNGIGWKQVEVKLDGVRILSIVTPEGTVEQFSRNGKEVLNFPEIRNQLSNYGKYLDQPYVFDGEIMSDNFQDLMSKLYAKNSIVDTSDSVLWLFDMIPLSEFKKGKGTVRQIDRSDQLAKMIDYEVHENIVAVSTKLINFNDTNDIEEFNSMNKIALEQDYEGLMIKDIDAVYECKRSSSWLKKKPFITVDLVIDSVEEGSGKNVGKLGAFVCSGEYEGKEIICNVGGGFSDNDRKVYFESRNDLIGKMIEVECDKVTQSKDSENEYSLRFPVFKRFRNDKGSK